MEQEGKTEPRGQSVSRWLTVLSLAVVLYVLSSGPAVYLRERGFVSKQMVRVIYTPLIPFESGSFESYIGWWAARGRKT